MTNHQDRTNDLRVTDIVHKQRSFFATGKTKAINFRKEQLSKLRELIRRNEQLITNALHDDIRKPPFEAFTTEIGPVLEDLKDAIRHIGTWSTPKAVKSPLSIFPARSRVFYDPYGVVLIIAPWNYPFSLMVAPLVGALVAGNVAILKTSPLSPNTSRVMKDLLASIYPEDYVAVVEGHRRVTQALLAEKFDYIFFTGSPTVGQVVYEAVSKNLTPVTLELGGKSPCIVADDADIEVTARRVAWGKFVNAGQTCIAPDYLMVSNRIKRKLFHALIMEIKRFYGSNRQSKHYGRMISDHHFNRVSRLISGSTVITGGDADPIEQ